MILYLMRHGLAVEAKHPDPAGDEARPLSVEGRRKTRAAALGLRSLGVGPARVGTSPLPRARETAEIVAEVLGPRRVELCDALRPGTPCDQVLRWLRTQTAESLLLVGHEPDLSSLAGRLLVGDHRLRLTLKRAAVCAIQTDSPGRKGAGRLLWLLQPKALRALRRRAPRDDE